MTQRLIQTWKRSGKGIGYALSCALFAITFAALSPLQTRAEDTLQQFQWQSRLLLLFTPDRSNAQFQQVMRASQQHQQGFVARDLLRISVMRGANNVTVHGAPASDIDHAGLPGPEQLYARYNIDKGKFAVLLLGKDGTVKARWQEPIAIDTIFDKIDAMPMRKEEMQESGRTGASQSTSWFSSLEL